ncbi:MAG: aspartate aminotransferase family protein [Pseudomonadota bacterium]|nr:aspartate aminotransferase family protein [Pseudomonadota bacterium]
MTKKAGSNPNPYSLDPEDWQNFRQNAHLMLDDMLEYLETLRLRPVWQPIPESERSLFRNPLPWLPEDIMSVHKTFMNHILPFGVGNSHPRFMGWIHGGGTPAGMLAEMLSAGLNANLGGRNQIPVAVEQEVIHWMLELFGFPDNASGIFVTGTSIANLIGLLVARTAAVGDKIHEKGVEGENLVAYASASAHTSILQAFDLAGLGTLSLRSIPVNKIHQIDIVALENAINDDKRKNLRPFFIAATAGTVDVGAIDDLSGLSDIARREKIWLHVDGALGALAILAPDLAPRLKGIEFADSLAFDFHKLGQVPYDAGVILVRDAVLHHQTFVSKAAYLHRETQGVAGGSPWPCDFGPDLSRGFRAFKAWFTFKVYGAKKIGEMISNTCALARYMQSRILSTPDLELLAPVSLNIVCFRYLCSNPDEVNAKIAIKIQESGIAVPSTTRIDGKLAIRAAITNHRTSSEDIDALLAAARSFGISISDPDSQRPLRP